MEHLIYKDHLNVKFYFGTTNILLLEYSGFLYKRTSGRFPRTEWKCTFPHCRKFVRTDNGIFEKETTSEEHGHPPPITVIDQLKSKKSLTTNLQKDLHLPIRQVYSEECRRLLPQDINHLALETHERCTSTLARIRAIGQPKNPAHRRVSLYEVTNGN